MRRISGLILFCLIFASCSTPEPEPLRVHHFLIESLRFRKSDGAFSCATPDQFLSGLKWGAVLQCLQSARNDATISFLVDRGEELPELVLQDVHPDKKKPRPVPACVEALLAKIPVPREIFYQGEDLDCYASGLKMMKGKVRVEVALPVASPLRTEADVRRLVLSWLLTPFWSEERADFPARPLTDSLCQECLGEGQIIRSLKPPRALWPAD